ncbi:MAG: allophanate hydrolase [Betaproteobacteria bacterium]|nr:allophanate hydrolase [Betaproteobacteria bacterium]
MTTALAVLKGGICSTVQDLGRVGYRAYGVPVSGALDTVTLELANALVGNAPHIAAIEMLYAGAAVQAQGGRVRIAVCGAEATLTRHGSAAAIALPRWQSVVLEAGDIVRVGHVERTSAAYLAVEGGIDTPLVLGSASTYLRGALGGWHGRILKAGDVLPVKLQQAAARAELRYVRPPTLEAPRVLRVIAGPQHDRFSESAMQVLLASEYGVSSHSDRSGLRLEGPPLQHVGGFDLSSEGVATGSIQVPGSGLPVILIADHPTVGGYPKIATIITADLPAAGRLRMGSRVSFSLTDGTGADEARAQLRRDVTAVISSLEDIAA